MNKRAGKIHASCETRRTSNARRAPKNISLSVSLSYGLLTKYSDLLFKAGLTRDWMYFFDDDFGVKRKPFSAKVRHVIVDVVTFLF